jgi:hypothetical protein
MGKSGLDLPIRKNFLADFIGLFSLPMDIYKLFISFSVLLYFR